MRALLLAALLLPAAAHAAAPAVDWPRLLSGWAAQSGRPAPDLKDLPQPRAVPGQAVVPLRGLLSVWSQDCAPPLPGSENARPSGTARPGAPDCGLPSPIVKNDPVELALPLPEKPGEFRTVRLTREYPVSGGTLKVQADFYALCPPTRQCVSSPEGTAETDCPGRYFSVQVELSGAAAALCTVSLNAEDLSPFPVLACGAPGRAVPGGQAFSDPGRGGAPNKGKRLGVTLHRAPLP